MIHNKSNLFIFLCLSFIFSTSFSYSVTTSQKKHPLYVGLIAGYGSTTWQGLVATEKNQNVALMLSTPTEAEEGGATWGILAGYEFTPYFALEANYVKYPESTIYFNPVSLYSFTHEGALSFSTKTKSVSLMGKIMLLFPDSNWRVFSGAGAAALYRKDSIVNDWRLTPTFGLGVNYNFTEHLMGELVGNYTAGFGESLLSPVDTYFPFLYSITAHLAYRF